MLANVLCVTCLAASVAAQATVSRGIPSENEGVLSGTVLSADGSPIPGASVCLRERWPRESVVLGQATTQSDGRFSIRAQPPPGDRYMRTSFLEIEAPGLASSHLEHVYVPPPSYDVGAIVLSAPVELRGRVVTIDGRPIAGAEIHAELGSALAPYGDCARRPPIAVTDSNGQYVCRALPPGLVTVGASADGFADRVLTPTTLRAGQPNQLFLALDPERVVRLHVTSKDGAALPTACAEPIGEALGEEPWAKQSHVRAFWRSTERANQDGEIVLRGVDDAYVGQVVVTAKDCGPKLVDVHDQRAVQLDPVTSIEVVATRNDEPEPEIYCVEVRDMTRAASYCGNCEDTRWAKLWLDSPAVERLAPNRWRIAWNGRGCYVDGGRPGRLSAELIDGTYAQADVSADAQASSRIECKLAFDPPARLQGVVRDPSGAPVAVRLGVQLSMYRPDWLSVVSGADGRFDFDRLRDGPQWLYSLDDRWQLEERSHRVELVAGQTLEGVALTVTPHPGGRAGRVHGLLRIAGKPPSAPVLLALDEVPNQHLPDAYPRGFAWTDRDGRFEIGGPWARDYHLVPKHTPKARAAGWRDFANEFPRHDSDWPWTVSVPESGVSEVTIDLAPESDWDGIAPPKEK